MRPGPLRISAAEGVLHPILPVTSGPGFRKQRAKIGKMHGIAVIWSTFLTGGKPACFLRQRSKHRALVVPHKIREPAASQCQQSCPPCFPHGSRHCYAMCGTRYAAPAALRSAFAAQGAGTLRLRLRACLPSQLRKPFRRRFASPPVLLRMLRSHLRCLHAALGALWSPREAANPKSGFAFNVFSRRRQITNR